jgi:plasmid stability protein
MHDACKHDHSMPKNIQLRNVPDELHKRLKVRAASEGMTLTAFILRELQWLAELPSQNELLAKLSRPKRADLIPTAAEIIREERDRR